jgi:hypothetical protein
VRVYGGPPTLGDAVRERRRAAGRRFDARRRGSPGARPRRMRRSPGGQRGHHPRASAATPEWVITYSARGGPHAGSIARLVTAQPRRILVARSSRWRSPSASPSRARCPSTRTSTSSICLLKATSPETSSPGRRARSQPGIIVLVSSSRPARSRRAREAARGRRARRIRRGRRPDELGADDLVLVALTTAAVLIAAGTPVLRIEFTHRGRQRLPDSA